MAILTLLSDLGYNDASVGIAKGILMQYVQPQQVADISHDIAPFGIHEAAYVLGACYHSFPQGTVHVVLVDIFSDAAPRLVLSEENGHYFLAADNGLLPEALGKVPATSWLCFELTKKDELADWLNAAGRIAQQLATTAASELRLPAYQLKPGATPSPRAASDSLDCTVLHTDHYENVVVDVTQDEFARIGGGRPFRLEFMQVEELNAVSPDYRDVRPGYKLARFNSNGYLEICINKGKAASLFGLKSGSTHNNIKLIFE